MIALGFAIAFALSMAALAYWDVNRRRIAAAKFAHDDFAAKVDKIAKELVRQCQEQIEDMDTELKRSLSEVYARTRTQPPADVAGWQQRALEHRAETRIKQGRTS